MHLERIFHCKKLLVFVKNQLIKQLGMYTKINQRKLYHSACLRICFLLTRNIRFTGWYYNK
jgi:hypothetical protein